MHHRERLIKEAYEAMLAGSVIAGSAIDPERWAEATVEVDRALAAEARHYSDIIWASPLAGHAQALIDGVEAAKYDHNPVVWVSSLKALYGQARRELLVQLMADAGQDVCRQCREVKPSDEIKLVCVHECFLMGNLLNGSVVEAQYFGYLCADCRKAVPLEVVSIGYPGSTQKPYNTFRTVYSAVEFGGMFWADDDGVDVRSVGGFNKQPACERTGAFEYTEAMATAYGVPPDLTTYGALGSSAAVVIQMIGYRLPLVPATVTV